MSQPTYELQVSISLPEGDVIEDDGYSVTYNIENIGSIDFPAGGNFLCRLYYPLWDPTFGVRHEWHGIRGIPSGETLPLPPYDIKSVAGPNAFVFLELSHSAVSHPIELVKENGDELYSGEFIGYLRVKTREEHNSERNLKIAASALKYTLYSTIILIGMGFTDWFLQLWLREIWCIQNLILSTILTVALSGLLILLVKVNIDKMNITQS